MTLRPREIRSDSKAYRKVSKAVTAQLRREIAERQQCAVAIAIETAAIDVMAFARTFRAAESAP